MNNNDLHTDIADLVTAIRGQVVEHIEITGLPIDTTDGNEIRDFMLDDLLHEDEWLELEPEDLPAFLDRQLV